MSKVSKKWTKAVRRERSSLERTLAQLDAWERGKKVVLNIPNSNPHEKGKPFLRVDAKEVWRKQEPYIMKTQS
jgi:hypothetical protein